MKRILTIFLVLTVMFSCISNVFAGDYTSSDPNKNSSYNRTTAYNYQDSWWNSRNTNEYYDAGYDCTNYVSQVLHEAGMGTTSTGSYSDTSKWAPYQGTWENAHYFRSYWGNVNDVGYNKCYSYKIFTKTTALNDFYNQFYIPLYQGDVIQYADSNGNTGHSQTIYDYDSYGNIRISQHSSNNIYDLEDYITSTSYYYVFRYQIKNGA